MLLKTPPTSRTNIPSLTPPKMSPSLLLASLRLPPQARPSPPPSKSQVMFRALSSLSRRPSATTSRTRLPRPPPPPLSLTSTRLLAALLPTMLTPSRRPSRKRTRRKPRPAKIRKATKRTLMLTRRLPAPKRMLTPRLART